MAKNAKAVSKDSNKGKKPETQTALIPVIKPGALSTDVGPMVIAGLAKAHEDEQKANAMLANVEAKRYDLLATTTMAIVKAAKADSTIDLTAAVSSGTDAKKLMSKLNDQLGLALGFREVVTGKGGVKKVATAKTVSKFFPMPGEDKDSPVVKAKATVRSNFIHMLKKCSQTALGIIERGIQAKPDKESGTLLLSGPAIKKQFGQQTVLLNEKQTVKVGQKDVKLAEKPSFTAIAAKAAEAHGKVIHRGSNTRGTGQQLANPSAALASLCKSLVQAIEKLPDELNEEQQKALESVRSAIDRRLD